MIALATTVSDMNNGQQGSSRVPPTGWYPDPEHPAMERFWDASAPASGAWLELRRPARGAAVAQRVARSHATGRLAVPGWYPDNLREGQDRLWDGEVWTEHVRAWPRGFRPDPRVPGQRRYWDGTAWTEQTQTLNKYEPGAVTPSPTRQERKQQNQAEAREQASLHHRYRQAKGPQRIGESTPGRLSSTQVAWHEARSAMYEAGRAHGTKSGEYRTAQEKVERTYFAYLDEDPRRREGDAQYTYERLKVQFAEEARQARARADSQAAYDARRAEARREQDAEVMAWTPVVPVLAARVAQGVAETGWGFHPDAPLRIHGRDGADAWVEVSQTLGEGYARPSVTIKNPGFAVPDLSESKGYADIGTSIAPQLLEAILELQAAAGVTASPLVDLRVRNTVEYLGRDVAKAFRDQVDPAWAPETVQSVTVILDRATPAARIQAVDVAGRSVTIDVDPDGGLDRDPAAARRREMEKSGYDDAWIESSLASDAARHDDLRASGVWATLTEGNADAAAHVDEALLRAVRHANLE